MTVLRPNACDKEARAVKCARTGFWDAGLDQHVASCPVCAEAVSIARLLNEMRAVDEASAQVPGVALMWRKAHFLATRDAGERATRPISFVERFAYALALVCAIAACVWRWYAIRGWFAAAGSSGTSAVSASASNIAAYSARVFVHPGVDTISLGSSGIFIAAFGVLLLCGIVAIYIAHSEA